MNCLTFAAVAAPTITTIIPRLYDKQTSSNHRANIQEMHSKYTCTICALIARCLLDVCSMTARYLLNACSMFA